MNQSILTTTTSRATATTAVVMTFHLNVNLFSFPRYGNLKQNSELNRLRRQSTSMNYFFLLFLYHFLIIIIIIFHLNYISIRTNYHFHFLCSRSINVFEVEQMKKCVSLTILFCTYDDIHKTHWGNLLWLIVKKISLIIWIFLLPLQQHQQHHLFGTLIKAMKPQQF